MYAVPVCTLLSRTLSTLATSVAQARSGGPAELQPLLSCGKVCHAQLPACPHLCEAPCHLGPCPGASDCQASVTVRFLKLSGHGWGWMGHVTGTQAERAVTGICMQAQSDATKQSGHWLLLLVQVRCACRRQKEKRVCVAVRRELAGRGLPASIQDMPTVQLLECDAKCAQLKVSAAETCSTEGLSCVIWLCPRSLQWPHATTKVQLWDGVGLLAHHLPLSLLCQEKKQKAEALQAESATGMQSGAAAEADNTAGKAASAPSKKKLSREEKARERELRVKALDDVQKRAALARCASLHAAALSTAWSTLHVLLTWCGLWKQACEGVGCVRMRAGRCAPPAQSRILAAGAPGRQPCAAW